jgi:glycosyltransferase involved in cell wall biosynthesis
MKLLHVIPSYEPAWAFGGTVTATVNLCRALASQGIDVTVYTTDADGKGGHLDVSLNEPVDLGGVKVWYFKCDFGVKKAFYSRGLAKKLEESIEHFDIIDVSAIWQWIQVDVSRSCHSAGVPFVVTPHNSLSSKSMNLDTNLKKKIYWELVGKSSLGKASAIHFLSEDERELSKQNASDLPSFIVPNGIDTSMIKSIGVDRKDLRQKLDVSEDEILLLFVGRIHPSKRLELVIKALGFLGNKNITLVLIGPVSHESCYKYLVDLISEFKLKDKIILLGEVDNKKILEFYAAADLLFLMSNFEGVSMTSLEALASGLPVLVSEGVSNWKDIVEAEAGLVVKGDHVCLAEVLAKIANREIDLEILSNNARKTAEEKYSLSRVASLMIKAYEDVLTGRRSPELQWQ